MKKGITIFLTFILMIIGVSSAKADPTYAMVDANGNVTNIIVCGEACAGGTFNGQKVVLQVAENPVTHENAGGVWQGPGTTTYNESTGVFTVRNPEPSPIVSSYTEIDDQNNEITSTVITSSSGVAFTYNDTVSDPYRIKFTQVFEENSPATMSVIKKIQSSGDMISESITFTSRKTSDEIRAEVMVSQANLIISKIDILIKMLDGWVK